MDILGGEFKRRNRKEEKITRHLPASFDRLARTIVRDHHTARGRAREQCAPGAILGHRRLTVTGATEKRYRTSSPCPQKVVKYSSRRGLAIRGTEKVFGSPHIGNFMGTLELLAEFDPFICGHVELR
ncbi:hypothetical protein TNCV_3848781 [Trichonephila clavipes]|uniref:Uncharacterized protein n=1 Tax=Trichonephila clavipes TaxID=2585209 RepID=A0A8X6V0I6_TRICX|nr:hypothetical protein TNCV_3848781 [Trichonephila clavipes]